MGNPSTEFIIQIPVYPFPEIIEDNIVMDA
jgi:hypothetical protein